MLVGAYVVNYSSSLLLIDAVDGASSAHDQSRNSNSNPQINLSRSRSLPNANQGQVNRSSVNNTRIEKVNEKLITTVETV